MTKILVVDDEATFIKLAQFRLESNGYEVITAKDGAEGLKKAKSENPDLIILDVVMPEMDGYQVCRLLKKDARYNKIPIILCTGKAKDKFEIVGSKVGADVTIRKPFDISNVLVMIEKLLRKP